MMTSQVIPRRQTEHSHFSILSNEVQRKSMNRSRLLVATAFMPGVLALTTTGCATKKYVSAQIAPLNGMIAAFETAAKEQTGKEQADISRVEAKIAATDGKVAEATAAAERANTSAAQANQLGQQDQAAIAANRSAIAANANAIKDLEKAMKYSIVARGDVTFGFNRSNLDKTDLGALGALDALAQQARSMPRAELRIADPNAIDAESRRLARRVLVRIYTPSGNPPSAPITSSQQ